MGRDKEIRWIGSSYDDLLAFPRAVRREAGFQLGRVQAGLDPTSWKPFDDVGIGTKEIRISDSSGVYRVMYIAKFEEAVYILHCFQKTTQVTSTKDKAIAQVRFRAMVNSRRARK
jgi:phage-related protein